MPEAPPSNPLPGKRFRALVVARRGPARSALLRALRAAGFVVGHADDGHAGIAAFVERPYDVVIVSIDGWASRDLGFLREIRRRDPSTRILLTVPEAQRPLAMRALQAGADGWLPDPYYGEEVVALVTSYVRQQARRAPKEDAAVEVLAYWVKHHLGNVAQILNLGDSATIQSNLKRLDPLLRILADVAFPSPGQPELTDLAGAAEAALDRTQRATPGRRSVRTGIDARVPRQRLDQALDALVDCLIGLARDAAIADGTADPSGVTLDLRVESRARVGRRPANGRILLRVPDLPLDPEKVRTLRESPVWVGEWTREPHAGLWILNRLARELGGALVFHPSKRGTWLGLWLPTA